MASWPRAVVALAISAGREASMLTKTAGGTLNVPRETSTQRRAWDAAESDSAGRAIAARLMSTPNARVERRSAASVPLIEGTLSSTATSLRPQWSYRPRGRSNAWLGQTCADSESTASVRGGDVLPCAALSGSQRLSGAWTDPGSTRAGRRQCDIDNPMTDKSPAQRYHP